MLKTEIVAKNSIANSKIDKVIGAEQATLGSCLLDREALTTTYETLVVADFSRIEHKKIFQIIHLKIQVIT